MKKILMLIVSITIVLSLNAEDKIEDATFNDIAKPIIGDKKYIIDKEKIRIKVPNFADNSLQVPIFVDASKIKNSKRMVLFADYNPIPLIADMKVSNILPVVSTNIKVAAETPLRVLVLDENDIWHVSTALIKSAGGGCDVSSLSTGNDEFAERLGTGKIKVFDKKDRKRIKASIFHPMETGLVFGSSEFFINKIVIKQENKTLSTIKTTSVISENPRFIFEAKNKAKNFDMHFFDNDGNEFKLAL